MNEMQYLSKNLKAYKEMRNLSIHEFAKELGIAESTIRNVMKSGNMTVDTLIRISKGLNVSLDMLVYDRHMADKLELLSLLEGCAVLKEKLPREQLEQLAEILMSAWEVTSK